MNFAEYLYKQVKNPSPGQPRNALDAYAAGVRNQINERRIAPRPPQGVDDPFGTSKTIAGRAAKTSGPKR